MVSMSPEAARHTMHGAPLWARAATVAAGPAFNFALSILVWRSRNRIMGLGVGFLVAVIAAKFRTRKRALRNRQFAKVETIIATAYVRSQIRNNSGTIAFAMECAERGLLDEDRSRIIVVDGEHRRQAEQVLPRRPAVCAHHRLEHAADPFDDDIEVDT